MSFLIRNGNLIAYTPEQLKSGDKVKAAYKRSVTFSRYYNRTKETINANREYNLVNSFTCYVSNAAKYKKQYQSTVLSSDEMDIAQSINDSNDEFYIS